MNQFIEKDKLVPKKTDQDILRRLETEKQQESGVSMSLNSDSSSFRNSMMLSNRMAKNSVNQKTSPAIMLITNNDDAVDISSVQSERDYIHTDEGAVKSNTRKNKKMKQKKEKELYKSLMIKKMGV